MKRETFTVEVEDTDAEGGKRTEDAHKIVYEKGDRLLVGLGGGQVSFTLSYIRDNGELRGTLGCDPAGLVDVHPARVVQQATTEGVGKIEHLEPIPSGWYIAPDVPAALNVGDELRHCPFCKRVLPDGSEREHRCDQAREGLTAVAVLRVEAL